MTTPIGRLVVEDFINNAQQTLTHLRLNLEKFLDAQHERTNYAIPMLKIQKQHLSPIHYSSRHFFLRSSIEYTNPQLTVEELQAAHEKAFASAIESALDEGTLTQEQADNLLSGDRFGHRERHGFRGFGGDMNEHLAEALGISITELEAAQAKARDTVITEAIEAGTITQEQADLMSAREAVSAYIQDAMTKAYGEAVEQALAEGVITQAQADLLLENGTMGFRGPGGSFGFGGHGKGGGRGHFGPGCNGD